ncbi:sterol desaturase family protein [Brucellaceae bacterium C25G]
MMAIAFPILLLIILVLSEMIIISRTHQEKVDWHDVVFNLNSGHMMLWLFRGLELACYGFIVKHLSFNLVQSWPTIWVWLLAILMWDLCFYWLHRLHHKFALLWAVHVVHHQGEHFNLSLAVRNSWYSSLASIPFFIPMALIGIPLPIFITVSVLHYSIQLMNHSALTPRLGWLEYILVTPAHHRIHHVNDRAYSDTNYAGSFAFWDRIFGTYRPDLPEHEFAYGVKGKKSSLNPLIASNEPFRDYLKMRREKRKAQAPDFTSSGFTVLTGALILFLLVTGYIWLFGYQVSQSLTEQMLLFVFLAAGSVALGGISEGKQWGVVSWLTITWLMLLSFATYFQWHSIFWMSGMIALTIHSTAVFLGWGRKVIKDKENNII